MISVSVLLLASMSAASLPADKGLEYTLTYGLGGSVDCAYEPNYAAENAITQYWGNAEDDFLKAYAVSSPGTCPDFVPLASDNQLAVYTRTPTINGGPRLKFNPDMSLRVLGGSARWAYMMSVGSGLMVAFSTFPSTTEGLIVSLWNTDGVRLYLTAANEVCYSAQMGAVVMWTVCSPPDSVRPTEAIEVFAWTDNAAAHILVQSPRGEFSGDAPAQHPGPATYVGLTPPHVGRSVTDAVSDGIGMEIAAWWFITHAEEASNRIALWSAFKARY